MLNMTRTIVPVTFNSSVLLGVTAFLAAAAYWPGISGAATAPRWAVIAVLVPGLAFFRVSARFAAAHLAGLAFVAWCAASLAWTETPLDSTGAMWRLVLLGGLFYLGSTIEDLRPVLIGFALGVMVSSCFAVAQFAGYRLLPEVETPSGLFVNRNFLAEAAALCLVGCVASRLWWCIPALLPAIVLTGARGAILGLLAGILLWGWQHSRKAVLVACVLTILPVAAVTAYRGEGLRLNSIEGRFQLWADTIEGLTWTGHGYGSFYGTYPALAQRTDTLATRPDHTHNDSLEILYETGPLGLSLFAVLIATLLPGPLNAGRLVVIAFLVIGAFGFPLAMPSSAFLGVLCAGHVAGARRRLRDEAWYRGIVARAWPGFGVFDPGTFDRDQRSRGHVSL